MKKWIVSILVIIIFCGIRFVDPWFLDMVRMKALDQHQITQQEATIDKIEKSVLFPKDTYTSPGQRDTETKSL